MAIFQVRAVRRTDRLESLPHHEGGPEQEARDRQVYKNATDLINWLALYGIEAQLKSSGASEAVVPDYRPSPLKG